MSDPFAELRPTLLTVLEGWGRDAETPNATVARIGEMMLPSIRLVRKKGASKKAGCRAGGLPDLPEGTPWPHSKGKVPMSLVLQVNLGDLAPFDAESVLPADGLLSLFYYWDDDGGRDEGRVLYFPAPLENLHQPEVPDDLPEENHYKPYALEPRAEWTLPHRENVDAEIDLDAWFDLEARIAKAQKLDRERTSHRLLGHPDLIQSSSLGKGRVLLVQAGPDYDDNSNMGWGDGGMIYCHLSDSDRKAKRLDRAKLLLEMG